MFNEEEEQHASQKINSRITRRIQKDFAQNTSKTEKLIW